MIKFDKPLKPDTSFILFMKSLGRNDDSGKITVKR